MSELTHLGKRSMRPCAMRAPLLSAALGTWLSAFGFVQPGQAKVWKVPEACRIPLTNQYRVDGDDDDDQPVVRVTGTAGDRVIDYRVQGVEFTQDGGQAKAFIEGSYNTLEVSVSYTPFLDGYRALTPKDVEIKDKQGWTVAKLPDAGSSSNPERHTYGEVKVTFKRLCSSRCRANMRRRPRSPPAKL